MASHRIMKAAWMALATAAGLTAIAAAAPGLAAPATGARPAPLKVPQLAFTQRKLANGLTLIAMRDTTTPNVVVSVWYDVGSKHDPEGRSGFAHLFEHILSRKTRNMPYNMINRLTEDVGGVRNASTWYDRTNYYETVPARYLQTMLWTHAERMARPVIDAQVFETERNVVKEELRQRVLAPPYGRLFNLILTENGYDRSPNRRPTIGSIEQLDAATLEDARAFHEAYYGPDTATMIVSGNFDPKQLDAWVDQYFAPIPARPHPIPLAITVHDTAPTRPRTVTAYAPNVPLPVVASSWHIPGTAHRDMAPLVILDAILVGGDNSRLYQGLVDGRRVATAVGSNLNDVEDQGYYAPYAFVAGGKAVAEVEGALAQELDRIRAAPVTAAELAEAKTELLAQALRERETFSGRAFDLGEALVRTGDPRASDKRLAGIERVTIADVQRVARAYLAPAARVDYRYLNEDKRPAGQADAWANPVLMPRFKAVPPAISPPNTLADEADRQAPPAPSAAVAVRPPVIAEARLGNGLALVSARTGDVPLATMTLMVKGGGSTDPRNRAGLAAMAATLATKGTTTRSSQQIAAELESLGGQLSSGAGADGSFLSVSAPVANLEAAGRILADLAQNATFPADEIEGERKRALDGLAITMRDPGGLSALVSAPLFYGDAPYGTIVNGTPATLAAMTREDIVGSYRKWWHPGNSALIVAGGIDSAAAAALAERLFGGWHGIGPAPQAPVARAGDAQRVRTVVIDIPGAGQTAVTAAVRAVSRADADYYNLSLANAVLGAGSNGRLFQEVRVKRALSYGAYSGMPSRLDASVLSASAQTKNESAADVAKIFLDELDRLGREPIDADVTGKRIAFLSGNFNRQAETSGGLAAALANLIQQGLSPSEVTRFVTRLEAVTPGSASAAAARLASSSRATLILVGDSSKFIDKLRAIRPNVEVIRIADLDLDAADLRRAAAR